MIFNIIFLNKFTKFKKLLKNKNEHFLYIKYSKFFQIILQKNKNS